MKYLSIAWIALVLSCSSPDGEKKNEALPQDPPVDYKKLGDDISALAQAELMKSVQSALKEGGAAHAIKYCNVHATPLSDSISQAHNCQISRISQKNRNPNNQAVGREEKILLNTFLESSLEEEMLRDTLIENDLMAIYYKPIVIKMEACLKCHGQKSQDIDENTMAAIQKHYPDDKATNYRMGEFRGAWKVVFNKE